jgi:hypothetical protein
MSGADIAMCTWWDCFQTAFDGPARLVSASKPRRSESQILRSRLEH